MKKNNGSKEIEGKKKSKRANIILFQKKETEKEKPGTRIM